MEGTLNHQKFNQGIIIAPLFLFLPSTFPTSHTFTPPPPSQPPPQSSFLPLIPGHTFLLARLPRRFHGRGRLLLFHSPLEQHQLENCPAVKGRPLLIYSLVEGFTLLLYRVW